MYEKSVHRFSSCYVRTEGCWRQRSCSEYLCNFSLANLPTRIRLNHSEAQLLVEFSSSTSDQFVLISTHRQYCSAFPIAAPRRLAPRRVKAGATHY